MNKIRSIISLVLLFSITIGFSKNHSQPGKKEIFKFIRTVQVTDANSGAALGYIHYVPATDLFVVMLRLYTNKGRERSLGFKEYTTDMQPTGKFGFITNAAADATSQIIGNDIYVASMNAEPPVTPGGKPQKIGWLLEKFDAASWKKLEDVYYPLIESKERLNDPMVFFTDGQLDVSGQFDASGKFAELFEGAVTQHTLLSPDLKVIEKKILKDTPHICGSSMIVVDGIRYFITADAFLGDLIVMKYDSKWNYLGMIHLINEAHWSQGVVFDGKRFYVSYLSTSQRTNNVLPVYLNVHLAVFDHDWNLLQDEAITNYLPSDHRQPGRPWVIIHNDRLFVSNDIDTIEPKTNQEHLKFQAYVSIYKLK